MDKVICPIEFDESLRKKSVDFVVPGQPRGKERPRMARMGKHITTYTPKKTVEYEKKIRNSYLNANGNFMLENAIQANILAVFPVPKSTPKKKREELLSGNIPYTKKPDCDNVGKVTLDALNKVAYNDDSQICRLFVEKIYGEDPMVKVKLFEV